MRIFNYSITRLPNWPIALTLACATAAVMSASSQAPPAARQAFSSTATAILVDVVVRDRKGRPVTDLAGDEFEILEDGVAQKVDSFTRVSHGGGIGVGVAWKKAGQTTDVRGVATAPREPAPVDPEEATTALVFDHLTSESLRLAQKATLEYIPMSGETPTRVGVFATEPAVRLVQGYTTDRARVRKAVQNVLPSATSADEQKSERMDDLLARRRQLLAANEAAASNAPGGAAAAANAQNISQRDSELQVIRTELDMLRAEGSLDRAYKGSNTAQALLTVVQSLAQFPGRKTVVLFSEGLPVSPALSARLDWVIDVANRANITAYAVDAKGLRAKSAMEASRKEMTAFAEERFNQLATGTDRTDQPLTMAFERVEDTIKLDSRTGLARLSEETGGFLVEGSNDLTSAFRRIDEDNQFHYLLTYSPRNSVFDGKFRAIHVKVRRPAVQVFARKGYRALGSPRTADTIVDYEPAAVALLEHSPLPNAFPVHAAGFTFPEPARPGLTPVLVRVNTSVLHFRIDRERSTYSAHLAIVVRLRDGQGREVHKVSQQYALSGDAKDVDAARKGDILFYRETELPPGVYTMESIVFDSIAEHGSARVATLTVPVPAASHDAIGMSSLILVRRVEEMKGDTSTGPLYMGHSLIYPNAGEPIQKSTTAELPFYFTLYGDTQGAQAEAQLLRNGQPIAAAPVPLVTPGSGRLQQIGRLPIGSLPLGTYELRIRVTAGNADVSRSAFFTLQE
jgi:VWFA-related protein